MTNDWETTLRKLCILLDDALGQTEIEDANDVLKAGYHEHLRAAAGYAASGLVDLATREVGTVWTERPELHVHLRAMGHDDHAA